MTPDNREEQVREALDLRFTSGNAIPVERAHITADEWATIRAHIEALEARVRELEGDARRYRWLRDDAREALCAREQGDNPIHPHLWAHWPVRGERLDAAIDSAMQGEEVNNV